MHDIKNKHDGDGQQHNPFKEREGNNDKTDTGDDGFQYAAGHIQMGKGRDSSNSRQHACTVSVIQGDCRGDSRPREVRPDRYVNQASGRYVERTAAKGSKACRL